MVKRSQNAELMLYAVAYTACIELLYNYYLLNITMYVYLLIHVLFSKK